MAAALIRNVHRQLGYPGVQALTVGVKREAARQNVALPPAAQPEPVPIEEERFWIPAQLQAPPPPHNPAPPRKASPGTAASAQAGVPPTFAKSEALEPTPPGFDATKHREEWVSEGGVLALPTGIFVVSVQRDGDRWETFLTTITATTADRAL